MNLSRLRSSVTPRAAIALGVLVLVASVVSGREKPDASVPAAPPPVQVAAPAAASLDLDLERLRRPSDAAAVPNLFAPAQLEAPAPADAAVPRQPARPEAPPLPFKYLGQMFEGGRQSIFLARGEEHFNVRAGQLIDEQYRIESIAANEVAITYLPLSIRQTLAIPAIE